MPLSFATILGGMVTLIGTPTNIVIATFREQVLGAPYAMFDFAPVGLVVASHKNSTIIMGPGGYRFGDYWRMGLPLEIVIVLVGVPMIPLVWPL